ncbi:anaerobic ribonucleoside-triphosphate reductase activating protein [Terrilactibacillus sp. BCM23-1]|uniref:Anaerobic ribonucleoside-triphosphate reductase-activating protein n=1 Tax=Terrilactibacillus tamarindi TaxID=2599694 RepID=A0A6N8CP39_9BACI|nr:anaerobic ribonucleoside-triphosphate reductase activating protein [Terrilactibacillus tamarindi]MTT31934.1 anaerobic ribonucleoside-triphosphate reductase activating protein [Terrilactibacillus tamarindi]
MNYADYKRFDMLNGPGVRHSLFVSGCHHRCKGCWNAIAWNFDFGFPYTTETEDRIIDDLNMKEIPISGLSLLGGEPFEHPTVLTHLLSRIEKECQNKNVWCWTGFTFEEILLDTEKRKMLGHLHVLIDGKFELDKRDLRLKFRGSSNQRIIDVQKSIESEQVVPYKG